MSFPSLDLTATYAVAGAWRLAHDPGLWRPMWLTVRPVARRALLVALAWGVLTWPVQHLVVAVFMKRSARVVGLGGLYSSLGSVLSYVPVIGWLPLPSLAAFATLTMILGQCQVIIEFLLRRELRVFRRRAYHATVESSGHPSDWWGPYVEESKDPPYQEAHDMFVAKSPFYRRWANTVLRGIVLKAVLYALNVVPFFPMGVSAYIRSFDYSQALLSPYFEHKRMTPEQVNVFLTERHLPLRLFGFTCACLERVPLAGIFFSISSYVAAALLAEDIEKRQHLFAAGEIAKVDAPPPLAWPEPQYFQAHLVRATSLSGTAWRFNWGLPDQPGGDETLPAPPSPTLPALAGASALSTAVTDAALDSTTDGAHLVRRAVPTDSTTTSTSI